MKHLASHAICLAVLLAHALPTLAEEKPLAPLDPIRQKDRSTLVLPAEEYRLIPNPDGGLLLLCGDRLAWLEDDGVTMLREKKLPRHYTDLAPRDGYFVAVSQHDQVVEVLDTRNFDALQSIKLTTERLHRVIPHPKLPVSYITTNDDDVPFVRFDERTGDMRQDDSWLAREMVIDPTGSFMISAYVKWIQIGENLHVNGPNVITTPKYESVEVLIRYHLDETGMQHYAEMRDGVGGGMRGLAASHDARTVTFLSFAGMSGRSLGRFDALDFKKLPTSYAVKDGGDPKSLDYHPVLPIVGSPGKGGAVFFHRETGQPEISRLARENRLPAETAFDKLHFSPDGMNVLLLHKVGEPKQGEKVDEKNKKPITRVLTATPLVLSQTELKQVAQGPPKPGAIELPGGVGGGVQTSLYAKMQGSTEDWIKANNKFGPDSPLASDVIKASGKFLGEGKGFWMMLGSGLTKSGKTTVFAVHQGAFMTQELTDDQVKASGIGPMQLVQSAGVAFENRQTRRFLQLDTPTLEATEDGSIRGNVTVTKLGQAEHADFVMTFTHIGNQTTTTGIHHMGDWLTKEQSEQKFKFGSPVDDDKPKLLIGFLQIAALKFGRGNSQQFPLSDPVLLITVHEPKADE
ncbi:MAG: hypothetical protein AAGB26_03075 [Planctomycetota bacterium]